MKPQTKASSTIIYCLISVSAHRLICLSSDGYRLWPVKRFQFINYFIILQFRNLLFLYKVLRATLFTLYCCLFTLHLYEFFRKVSLLNDRYFVKKIVDINRQNKNKKIKLFSFCIRWH